MIALGCCDSNTTNAARNEYLQRVEAITRVPMSSISNGCDKLHFVAYKPDTRQPMTVRQVQQALRDIGFFPGAPADAICGYRTVSAIRLFQEYVRTAEKLPCTPDGRFGPQSQRHLNRWLDSGNRPNWAPAVERWHTGNSGSSEYTEWLSLLDTVKNAYAARPNRMLELVSAYRGESDTHKPAHWDFNPRHIHLIGIRRDEFSGKFDDVFVLLIKGMVFKFQGSTEPGASSNSKGTPFLVQGQHDYHFGWHRRQYLALRPQNNGVLVVRSKGDRRLDEHDLDNGLEANATINVHWGGKGGTFNVSSWSEGCQVINGTLYINHEDELTDCADFVARNNKETTTNRSKTRGAYNVLLDLVTALSGDTGTNTVKFTLLTADDLDLNPQLAGRLATDRLRAGQRITGR